MVKDNHCLAEAILQDGRRIPYVVVDNPPAGSMKYTFFAPDRSYVVQFFHDKEVAEDTMMHDRLMAIIGKYNPTISEKKGGAHGNTEETAAYFSKLFCWPVAIVKKPEFGIVAPAYPARFFFDAGASSKIDLRGKDKKSRWFTSPCVSKYLCETEKGNFQTVLRIAISLARGVRRLHQAGLAHSDLSCNNVLIDPPSGSAVIIDIDSLVVPGLYPPAVIGTKGYIAPEVLASTYSKKKRLMPCVETDLFALPVLLYEYLLHRHPLVGPRVYSQSSAEEDEFLQFGPAALFIEDPKDRSNRPADLNLTIADLGKELETLFLRAFSEGLHAPSLRPAAMEWERALVAVWDKLVPCENPSCKAKWYICYTAEQTHCPFCGAKAKQALTLRLKKQLRGKKGQWVKARDIVVYDKMPLFWWHFRTDVFPDEKASDRLPLAYIAHAQGRWHFVNDRLTGLRTPDGTLVPKKQAMTLGRGLCFRSMEEEGGVLIEVL